jgi:hypothetical protein
MATEAPVPRPAARILLAAALAVLLAGCLGAPGDEAADPAAAASSSGDEATGPPEATVETLQGDCGRCFEPTVAAGPDGTVYATTISGDRISRFRPGEDGSMDPVDEPSFPPTSPPNARRGDDTVHVDPEGRLWFTSLVSNPGAPVGPRAAGLVGIQVARSDDGGGTWSLNTLVVPPGHPGAPTLGADRQWVAFAPDGTAHMVFSSYGTQSGIVHGTSSDGGETWSSWDRAVRREERGSHDVAGPPRVADGQVVVPYDAKTDPTTLGGNYAIQVAAKPVDGGDWTRHTIAEQDPTGGYNTGNPRVVPTDDGGWAAAWIWNGQEVRTSSASSVDGDWSSFQRWNPENGPRLDPDAAARDGVLDVTWYRNAGEAIEVVLARGPVDGDGPDRRLVLDAFETEEEISDFADLAANPDGDTVVVWSTGDALRAGTLPAPSR